MCVVLRVPWRAGATLSPFAEYPLSLSLVTSVESPCTRHRQRGNSKISEAGWTGTASLKQSQHYPGSVKGFKKYLKTNKLTKTAAVPLISPRICTRHPDAPTFRHRQPASNDSNSKTGRPPTLHQARVLRCKARLAGLPLYSRPVYWGAKQDWPASHFTAGPCIEVQSKTGRPPTLQQARSRPVTQCMEARRGSLQGSLCRHPRWCCWSVALRPQKP